MVSGEGGVTENNTRLLVVVALVALCAIALVAVLVQRGRQPPPAIETHGEAAAPTALSEPTTPTGPPTPTPTLTREETIAQEYAQSGGQFTSSADECGEILETEDWCSVVEGTVRVTRPEWEELLSQTEFYVVKRIAYRGEHAERHNILVVEQDGQRYTAEIFDRLLKANGITSVTDESRELVTKAFALMTIPDYLEDEVVFTEWEAGDWNGYTHYLKAWTRIQGLEIWWWFVFKASGLRVVTRSSPNPNVGDYIDIPLEDLPPPASRDYRFRGE